MPRQSIHAALDTLHQQLRDPSMLDDADRQHLREVLHDIERALDSEPLEEHLGARVQRSIAVFEATHPTIAGALHGIVQSLSKL